MPLLTWWLTDPLPPFAPIPDLSVLAAVDIPLLAALAHLSNAEAQARLAKGHQPYLASIRTEPVAYGWVAREEAWIGELQHTLTIAPRDRYLWDFATQPAWRGQGVYPRLLQAVVRAEAADRFWIMHAPEHTASGRGI